MMIGEFFQGAMAENDDDEDQIEYDVEQYAIDLPRIVGDWRLLWESDPAFTTFISLLLFFMGFSIGPLAVLLCNVEPQRTALM